MSLPRSKCRSILLWIEIGHGNLKYSRELQKFKISNPSNTSFNSCNYSPRNVPFVELAFERQLGLGPTKPVSQEHYLRANDVFLGLGGAQRPIDLAPFLLAVVWNSRQLV